MKQSALVAAMSATWASAATNDALVPFAFEPLPLGSIKPAGWLRDQLQLMADGLAGHEHDFYNYVAHSSWLGQDQEYSDLNEGFPYWFNGLVPLAYGLDDARLKEQVNSAAGILLERQQSDGWIGPETGTARNFWGRMPTFLGLMQLAQANATWTEPIVNSLHKFNDLMHDMMANNYTGYIYHEGDKLSPDDSTWGRVRSQDMSITLQWLYEHYPGNQSQKLLDNMKSLHDQGLNWEDWYNDAAYLGRGFDKDLNTLPESLTGANYHFEHGVNVGQGLKAVAVVRRFTHNDSLIQTAMDGVSWTMKYHGAASGTIIADERLVGLAPYSGSELCTAVEAMYSLAYLYQALGTNYYADRAELAAFNALPAMLTPDWWGHQYMEEPNQPFAEELAATPFYNTNTLGSTFGLEPNYPCCTVNHPQGWPKFLANSFVRVGDNGLAHVLLSPGSVSTKLPNSGNVKIDCTTAYPFGDELTYTVVASHAMDFYVRVPAWAKSFTVSEKRPGSSTSTSSSSTSGVSTSSGLHKISVKTGTTTITYHLPSVLRTEVRPNSTVAVYNGALLYALEVNHTTSSTAPKTWFGPHNTYPEGYAPPQSRDWSYHNTSAWNIAIDPSTLKYHAPKDVSATARVVNPIFAPGAPEGYVTAMGCEIEWNLYKGSVPDVAPPVESRKCIGPKKVVRLVAYGSAKTHMADLPTLML